MSNERPKCPICGKYTGKDQVRKYEEMEDTVHRQCVELREWRRKYNELFKESVKLRNRGFWARVFNR